MVDVEKSASNVGQPVVRIVDLEGCARQSLLEIHSRCQRGRGCFLLSDCLDGVVNVMDAGDEMMLTISCCQSLTTM